MNTSYRILPNEYVDHSRIFQLVKRDGRAAMFKAWDYDEWEVVMIQIKPEQRLPGGYTIPAGEYMPKPSQWGIYAWTCVTLERAENRYKAAQKLYGLKTPSEQLNPPALGPASNGLTAEVTDRGKTAEPAI
jgi:hypothetical protein